MGDLSNEPSMEEILSSIKRIIAEDTEAQLSPPPKKSRAVATPARAAQEDEPEVLELTEIVESPEPKAKIAKPAPVADTRAALASDTTTDASRASLAALSALVVQPEVHGSDTLEGLVRSMLKPAISEWLDERLPEIVERMVAQEIRRITDRG